MKILNGHLFHKITLCCSRSIYTGDRRKGCMAPGRPVCPKLRSVMLIMPWQQQCSPLPALHTPSTLSFVCPPSCSSCSVPLPPPFFSQPPPWNEGTPQTLAEHIGAAWQLVQMLCGPRTGTAVLCSMTWATVYLCKEWHSTSAYVPGFCTDWKRLTVVSTEMSLGGWCSR